MPVSRGLIPRKNFFQKLTGQGEESKYLSNLCWNQSRANSLAYLYSLLSAIVNKPDHQSDESDR